MVRNRLVERRRPTTKKNLALAKQRAGQVTAGPVLVVGSPDVAEHAAHLGFDWVFLDWQHGEWTESTLNNALGRFLAVDCAPLVRVKGLETGTINRVLDMGAIGVIVPMIENAAQARVAASVVRYPPLGARSGGGNRLSLIDPAGAAAYFDHANDEVMLVIMVESESAISNVDEIMRVPGVDVVLIGPGDLMQDVKARGLDEGHFERLVARVAEAAADTGSVAGYVCSTPTVAKQRIAQGFRFICYQSDLGSMLGGLRQARDESRQW